MSAEPVRCVVYRSRKKDGLYLFVREMDDISVLPDALMRTFGAAESVMTLELVPGLRLARSSADEIISNLEMQGYHLQLPPATSYP